VSGSNMDADAPVLESDTKLIWRWRRGVRSGESNAAWVLERRA
jgi:hypothetical protein